MKALTLWQPWAHCIAHYGKDIENRSWRNVYRGPLLIHAGAAIELGAVTYIQEDILDYEGCAALQRDWEAGFPQRCIVAVTCLVDIVEDARSGWAQPDQFHWELAGTMAFPKPVPWRGAQGLWNVDFDDLRAASAPETWSAFSYWFRQYRRGLIEQTPRWRAA